MPLDLSTIREQIRLSTAAALTHLPPLSPLLEQLTTTCPNSTNSSPPLPLTIIRRKHSYHPSPVILLFHGGAYISGSTSTLLRPAREFALELNATVFISTYRLATEHQFPLPVQDGWAVAEFVAANASRWGGDVGRGLVVGGVSAGAQLGSVLAARLARGRGKLFDEEGRDVRFSGLYAVCPCLLAKEIVPERYRGLWRSHEGKGMYAVFEEIWEEWGVDVTSEWFSPMSVEGLKEMCRVYLQVGGKDALRDDGAVFERCLKDDGVEARLDCLEWMDHGGYTVFSRDGDEEGNPQELKEKTMDGMRWLLDG